MQKFIFMTTLLFLGFFSNSQEDSIQYIEIGSVDEDRIETRCKKRHYTSDGFAIGINTHYGQIEKKDAVFFGFKMAYVIDHTFDVGIEGRGFYTDLEAPAFSDGDVVLTGWYGGLHIAPGFMPHERIHISFPVLLGGGQVGYLEEDLADIFDGNGDIQDWDVILVAEPGVNAVFHVSRNFHFEIGMNYRFVEDVKLYQLDPVKLSGLSGGIGLKFGIL